MLLIDEKETSLLAAAALGNGKPPELPPDEFAQNLHATDSITRTVADSLKNMDLSDLKGVVTGENTLLRDGLRELTEMTVGFVPKLLVAILILWVGMKLAKMVRKLIIKALERRNAEPSLKSFLGSLVDVLLKAMIIIMAMDVVGIKATSFIALLGAMGLAIGMALQGTLQNFAGGVIILLMKPFKVGDYIECGQFKGYIQEIRIFHTVMRPFNGRTIVIPNSELSNKSLINHTKEENIRLDVVASVAYGSDLEKVKEVPEFKEAWEKHRCIIPAAWYYEREHLVGNSGEKTLGKKYMFQLRNAQMTWLAGLYRIENGLPEFVILTREASGDLKRIHERMPVVLPKKLLREWVKPDENPDEMIRYSRRDMIMEICLW